MGGSKVVASLLAGGPVMFFTLRFPSMDSAPFKTRCLHLEWEAPMLLPPAHRKKRDERGTEGFLAKPARATCQGLKPLVFQAQYYR